MYRERKYFLRMDRKCFSIFAVRFNGVVAEETYIIGQEDAKIILEIRFYRKLPGCVARKQSDGGSKGPSQDARASLLQMTKNRLMLKTRFIHLSPLKMSNFIWEELETKLWMLP